MAADLSQFPFLLEDPILFDIAALVSAECHLDPGVAKDRQPREAAVNIWLSEPTKVCRPLRSYNLVIALIPPSPGCLGQEVDLGV